MLFVFSNHCFDFLFFSDMSTARGSVSNFTDLQGQTVGKFNWFTIVLKIYII